MNTRSRSAMNSMKSQEFSTPTFPKMGCHSPMYKRPMAHTATKPSVTKEQQLSFDLGFEYEDTNGHGSLSSADEDDVTDCENNSSSSESVPVVKYHALKRQMRQLVGEREDLLLKISKLKDKSKQHERQLHKEESDRKNQLNIMKNTHEQAFSDKNRTISLFEAIVREQECELEQLRKISGTEGLGTCVDAFVSEGGVAITRLTTQLNQVVQEKNDILAQFFTQQSLIKQQQAEIKGLLRCKSENCELQSQTTTLNKTINNLNKQTDTQKSKLSEYEVEVARLRSEVDSLKQESRTTLSKTAVCKLEDHNTKLQDKLLRKEAEYVEMDMQHRQDISSLNDLSIEKDKQIGQLKLELIQQKSLPAVEKIKEVPVESQAAKLHLATVQSEAKELAASINRLKSDHQAALTTLQSQHKERVDKLRQDLERSLKAEEEFSSSFRSREEQEASLRLSHRQTVEHLEQQIKEKKGEVNQMRQTMANKIAELEQKKDGELEELEQRLRLSMAGNVEEVERLRGQLAVIHPQVIKLKQDCGHFKRLCRDLQQFHVTQCTSITQQLNQAIHDVSEHNKDLVRKYRKEMALRKKYHNELVELKGNIRVFCRVRPVIKEDGSVPAMVLSANTDDEDVLMVENSKGRSQSFEMDRLFTPEVSQQQVFKEVQALVTSCIDGYHVCIFAYGQTGSGKTYTMEGPKRDPGINQRALIQLFEEANDRSKDWTFSMQVAVMEIYNESVRDLLSGDPSDKLDIKLDQQGHLHVPGLSWVTVDNVEDVNRTFSIGHKNRATASTNMNEHSSRSHALLCVEVTGLNRTTGAKTLGKLNLVDLAGSERVSKSGADGARLKETQAINKSLSALGDVIAALRSKQSFVPYRNSKLTYLLQDSLGGDSKVLMIVQVSPVEYNVNETLCSLNFAQRVKSVELGMANRKLESAEVTALKGRLAQYEGSSPVSTPTKSGTPHGTPSRRK